MIAQVSFTAQADLKNLALDMARRQGITLKALLIYAMKSFTEGKLHFNLVATEEPEVEEIHFNDKKLNEKAAKLALPLSDSRKIKSSV